MDEYILALKIDKELTEEYFKKSLEKTEQQKMLESLLLKDEVFLSALNIADIACGGGTLSYHLAHINTKANFNCVDLLDEALEIAKKINEKFLNRFCFKKDNIYNLSIEDNFFDVTFCWQTLLALDDPKQALYELIRITKIGGKIYISSLFNLEHDVDIYAKVYDWTRKSTHEGLGLNYNTISLYTIKKWIQNKVKRFRIIKFETSIPFEYSGRGLGTYTIKCDSGYIQISGGMLMNWGILEIEK